jgi:hypothetical protein
VAEEAGRRDKGDSGTSHPGTPGCLEGLIKKSTELIELDGFFWDKGLMRRKEFFSILSYQYTRSTLKED